MHAIKGTYQNGQIILTESANWPDGTELKIEPISAAESLGIRDEDWPTSPEGIARLLALMDQIEPLEMTAEAEAEWQAARQARKDSEKATIDERAERLRSMFE